MHDSQPNGVFKIVVIDQIDLNFLSFLAMVILILFMFNFSDGSRISQMGTPTPKVGVPA